MDDNVLRLHLNRSPLARGNEGVARGLKALFVKYLKAKGLVLTPQRARILNEVLRTEGHFGAEELCLRLGEGPDKVSRATVYRALELLVGSGVVQKIRFNDDYFRFERASIGRHHDHIVCGKCGEVIEFYNERIEGLQNDICREMDFTPVGHSLVIFGFCERCRNAEGEEARDGEAPRRDEDEGD